MEKGRVDRHLASGLPYDATTTVTTGEGQVFVFVAVDHCTAECIGVHASKSGYGAELALLARMEGDRTTEAEIHGRFSHWRLGRT